MWMCLFYLISIRTIETWICYLFVSLSYCVTYENTTMAVNTFVHFVFLFLFSFSVATLNRARYDGIIPSLQLFLYFVLDNNTKCKYNKYTATFGNVFRTVLKCLYSEYFIHWVFCLLWQLDYLHQNNRFFFPVCMWV